MLNKKQVYIVERARIGLLSIKNLLFTKRKKKNSKISIKGG